MKLTHKNTKGEFENFLGSKIYCQEAEKSIIQDSESKDTNIIDYLTTLPDKYDDRTCIEWYAWLLTKGFNQIDSKIRDVLFNVIKDEYPIMIVHAYEKYNDKMTKKERKEYQDVIQDKYPEVYKKLKAQNEI